jgi:hypothetical protein
VPRNVHYTNALGPWDHASHDFLAEKLRISNLYQRLHVLVIQVNKINCILVPYYNVRKFVKLAFEKRLQISTVRVKFGIFH